MGITMTNYISTLIDILLLITIFGFAMAAFFLFAGYFDFSVVLILIALLAFSVIMVFSLFYGDRHTKDSYLLSKVLERMK